MKLNPITDNIMNRIHQNLTTEQKIQMLTTDFLDRVTLRETSRIHPMRLVQILQVQVAQSSDRDQ